MLSKSSTTTASPLPTSELSTPDVVSLVEAEPVSLVSAADVESTFDVGALVSPLVVSSGVVEALEVFDVFVALEVEVEVEVDVVLVALVCGAVELDEAAVLVVAAVLVEVELVMEPVLVVSPDEVSVAESFDKAPVWPPPHAKVKHAALKPTAAHHALKPKRDVRCFGKHDDELNDDQTNDDKCSRKLMFSF